MKINRLLTVALSLAFAAPAFGDSITLDMVIRDFHSSHPDFESFLGGWETGMVKSTLGADGTPVYDASAGQITSAATFADWYHDVPGTNLTSVQSISLDNGMGATSGGVYTYDNSSFFPIDGAAIPGDTFGNTPGYGHNYHFTVQIATAFTYAAGQSFSFRGDDDLWVFIDKKLVIDLGGVHGPVSGSVDLDTLGLTAGDNYSLDLFFAERHTVGSNFKIETSIASLVSVPVPEPGALILLGLGLMGLGLRMRRN